MSIHEQIRPESGSKDVNRHPFFNYTSGRWLYNEQTRLTERHLIFNPEALLEAVAKSKSRSRQAITSFLKIAEGGSYRVFEAVFSDGSAAIARLPYPCTVPQSFGIASEVATMQILRLHDIPIPQVLDWESSANNAVGSEYIIMAKAEGRELEHTWFTMTVGDRMSIMEKIVEVERKLFEIQLPASGSVYHKYFLESQDGMSNAPIKSDRTERNEFCVGPSTDYLWWYARRNELPGKRGPWTNSDDVLKSVALRELTWLERFAEPRYPREQLYRAFYDHKKVDPEVQKQILRDYLDMVPFMVPEDAELNKPTMRHPDLSPSNIFVSDGGEVTALIDWQHSTALPLFLQAKIPKHFQNWGDEDSENFRSPQLPENFDGMSANEKDTELEKYRKRQVHYFYLGYTSRNNKQHFRAISKPHLVMTSKLFDTAARPWEGDSTSLKAEIIKTSRYLPAMASQKAVCYSEEEITQCLDIDEKQHEADSQMQTLRDCFNINIDGWVPSELYDMAQARAQDVKKQMMEAADTEEDRKEVEENWPFQDHDEIK